MLPPITTDDVLTEVDSEAMGLWGDTAGTHSFRPPLGSADTMCVLNHCQWLT
jgi:hypothetical protein